MLCADSRLRSVNRTADLALCLELRLWAKSSGLFKEQPPQYRLTGWAISVRGRNALKSSAQPVD